jgi:hypothetical protein
LLAMSFGFFIATLQLVPILLQVAESAWVRSLWCVV